MRRKCTIAYTKFTPKNPLTDRHFVTKDPYLDRLKLDRASASKLLEYASIAPLVVLAI